MLFDFFERMSYCFMPGVGTVNITTAIHSLHQDLCKRWLEYHIIFSILQMMT